MRVSVAAILVVTGFLTILGTSYSVYYTTWLDTSNPALTSLPHPLQDSHFFASKKNPLNVFFLKKLWFWTTAVFAALYSTSPAAQQTQERLSQYIAATALWAVFTSWFFGPALLERIITLTGGECSVTFPSGFVQPLPIEYCLPGGPRAVSPSTHPSLFAASLLVPEAGGAWEARPRLRKGHDVSGHIFLLTLSVLFLSDQIARATGSSSSRRSTAHTAAIVGSMVVVALELFSVYVTSVYFHTPGEKLSGFFLGVSGFLVTQLPIFQGSTPLEAPAAPAPIRESSGNGQTKKRA